jgi:hypothetical protein
MPEMSFSHGKDGGVGRKARTDHLRYPRDLQSEHQRPSDQISQLDAPFPARAVNEILLTDMFNSYDLIRLLVQPITSQYDRTISTTQPEHKNQHQHQHQCQNVNPIRGERERPGLTPSRPSRNSHVPTFGSTRTSPPDPLRTKALQLGWTVLEGWLSGSRCYRRLLDKLESGVEGTRRNPGRNHRGPLISNSTRHSAGCGCSYRGRHCGQTEVAE